MENSEGREPSSLNNSDQVITSQIRISGENDLWVREGWGKVGFLNVESHFPCRAKCWGGPCKISDCGFLSLPLLALCQTLPLIPFPGPQISLGFWSLCLLLCSHCKLTVEVSHSQAKHDTGPCFTLANNCKDTWRFRIWRHNTTPAT